MAQLPLLLPLVLALLLMLLLAQQPLPLLPQLVRVGRAGT